MRTTFLGTVESVQVRDYIRKSDGEQRKAYDVIFRVGNQQLRDTYYQANEEEWKTRNIFPGAIGELSIDLYWEEKTNAKGEKYDSKTYRFGQFKLANNEMNLRAMEIDKEKEEAKVDEPAKASEPEVKGNESNLPF